MATEPKTAERRPIQLEWNGGDVVVTAADEDRFVRGSQCAVAACQNGLAAERFVDQFKSQLLRRLRSWCEQHADRVQSCYVPLPPERGVKVFVVTVSQRYDLSLSDALSDLELELDQQGWPANVVQLPSGSPDALRSYFDEAESVQVYGNGSRAQAEG